MLENNLYLLILIVLAFGYSVIQQYQIYKLKIKLSEAYKNSEMLCNEIEKLEIEKSESKLND